VEILGTQRVADSNAERTMEAIREYVAAHPETPERGESISEALLSHAEDEARGLAEMLTTATARADKAEAHAKELYEESLDNAKRYKAEIDAETKRADEAEAERDAARNALDVPDIALKAIANHAETLKEAKQIARAALSGMKGAT
jgi:hypothetical protein